MSFRRSDSETRYLTYESIRHTSGSVPDDVLDRLCEDERSTIQLSGGFKYVSLAEHWSVG